MCENFQYRFEEFVRVIKNNAKRLDLGLTIVHRNEVSKRIIVYDKKKYDEV